MPTTEVETLEKRKSALIARYIEMQENVDDWNEKIYQLTLEIEKLNAEISRARHGAPNPAP